MADKVPIKGTFDAAGEADGLSEFVSGDTVPYTHGGTGLAALGSALTVFKKPSGSPFANSSAFLKPPQVPLEKVILPPSLFLSY